MQKKKHLSWPPFSLLSRKEHFERKRIKGKILRNKKLAMQVDTLRMKNGEKEKKMISGKYQGNAQDPQL